VADEVTVSVDELRAELTERGQLEFDLAMARAVNKKLAAQIEQLKAGKLADG
jgi:hypothetical protein